MTSSGRPRASRAIQSSGTLRGYPYLAAVRGDLLARLGRLEEAADAFERAASQTRNHRERDLMKARASDCRTEG